MKHARSGSSKSTAARGSRSNHPRAAARRNSCATLTDPPPHPLCVRTHPLPIPYCLHVPTPIRHHGAWQAVNGLTINVRKMFLEMDQQLYDDCQRHFLEDEARAADVEELRATTWQRLEEAAAARSGGAGGEGQEGEGQGGMDVDSRGRAATNGASPGL
ncbi:unnamed protein product [Closterium sp. NIES-54]